ncbi:MAG: hypothetical protein Q8M76_11550, partial [Spirochaetaceae bacterium]|nr:hypothetical protein [Spirochaetaceae bacterium]
ELFVTARGYLADSHCSPEIVDVLPGSSALGRLAVVRARRAGRAALVGPEGNAATALAVESLRSASGAARYVKGGDASVLVDGAINRITQIASIPDSRFVYVLRVGSGELAASARAVRRMAALATLPRLGELARAGDEEATEAAAAAGLPTPAVFVEGPLTAATLARVPKSAATIVVEDLTKVFLEEAELVALRRGKALATAAGLGFLGFVAILRDLPRSRFERALGDPAVAALVLYNPYEPGEGERA